MQNVVEIGQYQVVTVGLALKWIPVESLAVLSLKASILHRCSPKFMCSPCPGFLGAGRPQAGMGI